jgi:hypothetical protein
MERGLAALHLPIHTFDMDHTQTMAMFTEDISTKRYPAQMMLVQKDIAQRYQQNITPYKLSATKHFCTVVRLASISAKFGICTVMGLVESK